VAIGYAAREKKKGRILAASAPYCAVSKGVSALPLAETEGYAHCNLEVVCALDFCECFARAAVNRATAAERASAVNVVDFEQPDTPVIVDPVNSSADFHSEQRALEGRLFINWIFAFCLAEHVERANVHAAREEMTE